MQTSWWKNLLPGVDKVGSSLRVNFLLATQTSGGAHHHTPNLVCLLIFSLYDLHPSSNIDKHTWLSSPVIKLLFWKIRMELVVESKSHWKTEIRKLPRTLSRPVPASLHIFCPPHRLLTHAKPCSLGFWSLNQRKAWPRYYSVVMYPWHVSGSWSPASRDAHPAPAETGNLTCTFVFLYANHHLAFFRSLSCALSDMLLTIILWHKKYLFAWGGNRFSEDQCLMLN